MRPWTSPINGLVGHLTQPLNHDCSTKWVWVHARIAVRRRWMGIPSATLVAVFLQIVPLWNTGFTCKKTDIAMSMHTE
jgi:hypothetical protein